MSPEFADVIQRLQRELDTETHKALVESRSADWADYLRRYHLAEGKRVMLERVRTMARQIDGDDGDFDA